MHAQLQIILDDLAAARERWQKLVRNTPDARWHERRDPARWSVAENIAHLNLSARAMQPLLDDAAFRAKALGSIGAAKMKPALFGRMLAKMVGPVPRVLGFAMGKVKTAAAFVPEGAQPRLDVSAEFERHLAAHQKSIRAADGLPLDQVKIESPFVKGAHYDGLSGWAIVVRHIHRHLDQAERIWG